MNWTWIYIGALYAGAVALARRSGVDLPKKVALFFYALVLVFFFAPLTQNFVMTQDDILRTMPPWTFFSDVEEAINPEMNDIPLQHTVWGVQVRESWKALKPPLWNQFAGSGYPLLANGQSQGLSPIRLLALPVPTTYFMAAEAAMKILIALTFAFLFCRGRGYSELASVTGAVIFGFGGFLHSWLHFPHVTAACWAPAVLYLIDRLTSRTPAAEATRMRSFGLFATAALVWTSILFGGHPETASHIFFLSLLYLLWIVFVEKRANVRVFLTLGGAMTVAAMLSAPFLLPFLEALPKSQRYAEIKASPLIAEAQPYVDVDSILVGFQAHYFGQVPFEDAWGPAVAEPVGGFAGVLGIASFFALLIHVVRKRAWRSTEFFFVIATVIVFGVVDGWPLLGDAIHTVLPVVAHARFRMLWVLLMGIQAAAAIDLTQRGERAPLLIGAGITAAMLAVLIAVKVHPDEHYRMVSILTSMRSMAVVLLAGLLTFVRRKPVVLALMVAVIFELWSVTRGWNPAMPAELMYPQTPIIRKLQSLQAAASPREPFRVVGIGPNLFPNTNAFYGIEEIRAHDPMSYDRYMGFLRLTGDYKTGTENYHAWYDDPNASVLDFLNVRYLIQDPNLAAPDLERWKLIYEGKDGRIYENRRFLPRFYAVRNVVIDFIDDSFYRRLRAHDDWAHTGLLENLELETQQQHDDFFKPRPEGTPLAVATIVEASPTSYRLRVKAPRWSLVASSIPWWPGWKVERNGEAAPMIRVNGAFNGFAVPPGEWDVRVYYSPWTWWAGCTLALAGVIVLVLMGWRARRAQAT